MQTYDIFIIILMILPDFALKHQLITINENYFINRRNKLKTESGTEQILDDPLNENKFYIYMISLFVCAEVCMTNFCLVQFLWRTIYSLRGETTLEVFFHILQHTPIFIWNRKGCRYGSHNDRFVTFSCKCEKKSFWEKCVWKDPFRIWRHLSLLIIQL